jgi:hypothetical protein
VPCSPNSIDRQSLQLPHVLHPPSTFLHWVVGNAVVGVAVVVDIE